MTQFVRDLFASPAKHCACRMRGAMPNALPVPSFSSRHWPPRPRVRIGKTELLLILLRHGPA